MISHLNPKRKRGTPSTSDMKSPSLTRCEKSDGKNNE
jgi:hypothetical protein